ncbi:hypothetical protein EIN_523260 [Entamoeba invadens IP1]|uniref:Uncharacterized protein n=1 Tax=Entamoeba invadens IP1 TaxID=370355 RepID=A0A0A1UG89_ENTIV|nr:hypothetical protein EIN_523260 [Entamoeba invadens IP1]ELP92448.1 hypothetical protein EIN_523260 [Entamoeba invadens IP1]|eukprot:XP_004259219.1 hypothetical protein EIN_523260 [Entamoeba invadens IP1]
MANQRALEQAAGRSGRQGQPGTVTIYLTDKDLFYKIPKFEVGNDNLAKLELYFSEYLRTNFKWIYNGKDKYGLGDNMFPFGVTVSIVLDIFVNRLSKIQNPEKFQDIALEMVQTAWSVFFSRLENSIKKCSDMAFCQSEYNSFLHELSAWLPLQSTNLVKAQTHIFGIVS